MGSDIGSELRTAREAKGLSIATLAQRIRVQPRTLSAIEINDLSSLPPRPFGRGFVRAYAEEVDLDPEQTVHSFFAQFPAATTPPPAQRVRGASDHSAIGAPAPLAGLGTAAAILLVVVTAAVVLGRRGDPVPEQNAVGTTGPATPAASGAAGDATRTAASAPAPAPAAAPAAPLQVTFTVIRECWVSATADGERTLYRTLQPNESHTLTASRAIALRFGDAGAVTWTVNGRQGSPLGPDGAIRNLVITPGNAATIK
jgi:cytoskeletal protein RodZ